MRKHDILCVYVRETERMRLKSKEREKRPLFHGGNWIQLCSTS